jgi:hypothetical protein
MPSTTVNLAALGDSILLVASCCDKYWSSAGPLLERMICDRRCVLKG